MIISLRNIKRQDIKRKEVVYAVKWFSEILMGKRLPPKLELNIRFQELGSAYGLCGPIDPDPYPRIFEIDIQTNLARRNIISTIAHELVHVKQYARRELIEDARGQNKFLGKTYHSENLNYWDHPWEIEAFGRETGLLTRYEEYLEANPKLFLSLTR